MHKKEKGVLGSVRVLLADDHTLFREGLKKLLSGAPDLVVTGEAASGDEVLQKIEAGHYDVVVLDIAMPGKNGIDVLKELRSRKPGLPVLMLTMYPEEQYAVRVLKAGAAGYLTKESAPGELITAIRRISRGRKYVGAALAEKLASDLGRIEKGPPHEQLSDREYQVMCLLAGGGSIKFIAEKLHLSPATISTYRARVLDKMGMKSNAELTRYALENGLIK
jgi:two-component system invasion response regulator UvrY